MTRARVVELTDWRILDFDPDAEGAGDPDAPGWMTESGPGDTYLALIEAGRLAYPFQGRGEAEAAWVRDREWWWRMKFEAPEAGADEVIELVFEGLDTFAEVYLDGALVVRTDNMFRRYGVDITALVGSGVKHDLAIRFSPPARVVEPVALPVWSAFTDRVSRSQRNLMRKAQFGWGWDWGPDLPTVGVWRPARIEVRSLARIADLSFATTALLEDHAEVTVRVELEGLTANGAYEIEAVLADLQGCVVASRHQDARRGDLTFEIAQPQLWWTADLGGQPLYQLTVRLISGDDVIDEAQRHVGLRTIELDQSEDPDEPGATFFRFRLNGVEIFAKGACWVPASSFVGVVDEPAYRRLIAQTVSANMNMIRVWGGGVYEPDLFYDLCDEAGVLVWQDFMFACAHYPEGEAFIASVRAEVETQVRRLRHHPSLALWCGNNEIQAMHRINADLSGEDIPLSGASLYDATIPALLDQLHPGALYRPSSPWGGASPNGMKAGDIHNWTVWHGVPPIPDDVMDGPFVSAPEGVAFTRYAEDRSRFVSEFGIQAAPAMATLKRWMDQGDLDLDSPGFFARIKDEAHKANAMMAPVTGQPEALEQYVAFTQWVQAQGLKFGIEHYRRRRPHCSGALLWQLNDCWPCVSWSLIDYDGVEKASYFAVRRAFAPVLASFKGQPGEDVELWITNDTLGVVEGEAVVALDHLDGRTVWRETVQFSAPPGGHARPWTGAMPRDGGLVLRVWSPDEIFAENHLLGAPISDVRREGQGGLASTVTRLGATELKVDISAETYAPFTHLISDRADLRLSENYFDLAAGQTHTVRVTASSPIGPDDVAVQDWFGPAVR